MFAKLFHRAPQEESSPPKDAPQLKDFEPHVVVHYGIPSTASILAFDSLQHLLAVGTLDGRIKVIGGDNIECLLISPNAVPLKYLEFLQNQGYLVSVSNENVVQVWDLEHRQLASNLQWGSNISAFSVVCGTNFMYVGDEYGYLSVLKFDFEEGNIQYMPYQIPPDLIADEIGIPVPDQQQSVVGLLAQPCSLGRRVLIAYQIGVIILWDISEDKAILVRGHKDLQLNEEIVIHSTSETSHDKVNNKSNEEQIEKEISALCWVSSDGSILAVGYVDGDIILWNLPTAASANNQKANKSSNNAVKLRLSSGDRRLPVIVLHWSNSQHSGSAGQLFVYGGDDIGSEEVLTILNLDFSSGLDALKCVKRLDLTLNGSYADIELVRAPESSDTTLFVLTNPGQLHVYNDECLTGLISAPDMKHAVNAVQCPVTLPTVEPYMTISKLCLVDNNERLQRVLKEIVLAAKLQSSSSPTSPGSAKWPVSGGFPSQLSPAENIGVERIYIAGYQDGYVRIWDATFPVFSLIFVLGLQVEGTEIPGASEPISALEFNSKTSNLAVGNGCGLVHLFKLAGESEKLNTYLVTETKCEDINLHQGDVWHLTAVFSLIKSPVRSLQYTFSGARIIVGHECGKVAVLDVISSSVLFLTDCLVSNNSPIVSIAIKTYLQTDTDDPKQSGDTSSKDPEKEVAFVLTKDAHIILVDISSGDKICCQSVSPKESTAISTYLLDENFAVPQLSEQNPEPHDPKDGKEPLQSGKDSESDTTEDEVSTSSEATELWKTFADSLILVCCGDSVLLHSTKSLIQGRSNFIRKIDLEKQCCWATTFKKSEQESGVILVYSDGVVEIRSLPDLNLLAETSLMSILRWSFKTNMEKTMSSFGNTNITMVYGCEFAVISLFTSENDFRIPEALPRLHDKVVAEAADAALKFSLTQKTKQIAPTGLLGGIIKGIRREKENETTTIEETRDILVPKLEALFSRSPFSVSDLDLDLGDDFDAPIKLVVEKIEVEPKSPESPTPSQSQTKTEKNKQMEREQLFEGGSEPPKARTADEIKAKYRKTGTGETAAVALEAKDKLLERQMKLEKLKENSEELASGSENFASLAGELVKQMENRKWWQL